MQISSQSLIQGAGTIGATAGRIAARSTTAAETDKQPLSRGDVTSTRKAGNSASRIELQGKAPLSMEAQERLMAKANRKFAAGGTLLMAATLAGGRAFAQMGSSVPGKLLSGGRPAAALAAGAAIGGTILLVQSHSLLKAAKQP